MLTNESTNDANETINDELKYAAIQCINDANESLNDANESANDANDSTIDANESTNIDEALINVFVNAIANANVELNELIKGKKEKVKEKEKVWQH
ncbi:MAG: hypothetical protein EZS28_021139 [Streblomastix strix]|uniref:Uncharacterized protein n=1 Tax=Streblomastix strix TaxID=222440 RepID=A0A5J4VL18_9EUKA|nr:MAG: hypothetical protein EZS28_021139 [Streblomastix strix]